VRVERGGGNTLPLKKNVGDVQMVTQYPRAENAQGKEVTAQMSIAAEQVGDGLVAIFCLHDVVDGSGGRRSGSVIRWNDEALGFTVSRDDIPHCRVERYGCQRKEEGRFGRVDEGTERHDCHVVVEETEQLHPPCTAEILRTAPSVKL
jgi:hypothetical protein